jgi:hypothetical protein
MLVDHIPCCPCPHSVTRLHHRHVHVVEEFMAEAGTVKGWDLRLEAR